MRPPPLVGCEGEEAQEEWERTTETKRRRHEEAEGEGKETPYREKQLRQDARERVRQETAEEDDETHTEKETIQQWKKHQT